MRAKRCFGLSLVVLAGLVCPSLFARAVADLDQRVVEVRLSNGMKVVLVQREVSPTVACRILFRAGWAADPSGKQGLARLLGREWLLGAIPQDAAGAAALSDAVEKLDTVASSRDWFEARQAHGEEGTPDALEQAMDRLKRLRMPCETRRLYKSAGGEGIDARIDADAAQFSIVLPSTMLDLFVKIESARMQDSMLAGFFEAKEAMVHRAASQESALDDDALEHLYRQAFPNDPYAGNGWGSQGTLAAIHRSDALAFKRRYFGPSTALVAIVGAIDLPRTIALVEEHFGAVQAVEGWAEGPDVPSPSGKPGAGPVHAPSHSGAVVAVAYNLASKTDPDLAAFDLLHGLLSSGVQARLLGSMIEPGLALYASTFAGPTQTSPALFIFNAQARPPHTGSQLLEQWDKTIAELSQKPVEPSRLDGVRRNIAAATYRELASNAGLAARLLQAEAAHGDWRYLLHYLERLDAVGPNDIMAACNEYLAPRNRITVELVAVREPDGQVAP